MAVKTILEAVKTCQSCNGALDCPGDTCQTCLDGDLGSVDFIEDWLTAKEGEE
jgi:hypothetical protein